MLTDKLVGKIMALGAFYHLSRQEGVEFPEDVVNEIAELGAQVLEKVGEITDDDAVDALITGIVADLLTEIKADLAAQEEDVN